MREGQPSLTAMGVALLRGIASAPRSRYRVHDPIARDVLPFPVSLLPGLSRVPLAQPLARVASGGLLDHVALRTDAIDREVRIAMIEDRIEQLVILGAGLDARAWRMDALAGAIVFEVDVASTQRVKRDRLERRAPRAREVRFVTVDFAKGELDAQLARAGHDPARPTIWIWEGVVPYLPIDAARATLRTIAARSAASSVLLVTYVTPEHVKVPPALFPAVTLPAVRIGFSVLGEPLVGALQPDAMRALLEENGLRVVRDSGSPDWARARGAPLIEITERLATARRA